MILTVESSLSYLIICKQRKVVGISGRLLRVGKINMRKFIGTILLFCAISTYFVYAIYQNLQTQRNDVSISINDSDVAPTSLTIAVIGDTHLPKTLMLIR